MMTHGLDPGLNMRKLFGSHSPDGREVDTLFVSLCNDGGGSVDLAELRVALKGLKHAAANQTLRLAAGI